MTGAIAKKSWLVTGGSRSGKSSYALSLASSAAKPFFIATGWAGDEEMAERIRRHKSERSGIWTAIETRLEVASAIRDAAGQGADFILVDCLTLWTSNILFEEPDAFERRVGELVGLIPSVAVPLAFVTNEVGSGIVPGDSVSRKFRDCAGTLNRRVAAAVDCVMLCVCGIPITIKDSKG